ncbi:MAG: PLDc_N domain-containing protein [Acidimicrobiia bacterium]|nr:PLDc_N domain-containing protein [Acidimicrobiia bacterium]
MLAAEGLVGLVLFLFWVWAIFDCISTDAASCRNLPKGMWLILVLILPDIGALAWLIIGRPERAGWRPGSTDYSRPGPLGLEDHPRSGASLEITDRQSAELDRKLQDWEREQAEKSSEG